MKLISLFKKISLIIQFIKLVCNRNSILFLVRYPSEEDLKDGYFQRVYSIDEKLNMFTRIYLSQDKCVGIKLVKPNCYEIGFYNECIKFIFLVINTLISGRVYCHSIFSLVSRRRFIFPLARKRVLDIHGAVPEEFFYNGDAAQLHTYNQLEKAAVSQANILIGVTQNMIDHIVAKYEISRQKKRLLIIPILPNTVSGEIDKDSPPCDEKASTIIYSGGLQYWQQCGKMLAYVNQHQNQFKFIFLVPQPETLKKMYLDAYQHDFPGLVVSVNHEEVASWYKKASYGLVLREDIIVNHVACPTKLIEYIQNDLIPIVDSPEIGDFNKLDYAYVNYDSDKLLSEKEWKLMISHNKHILEEIQLKSLVELEKLRALLY